MINIVISLKESIKFDKLGFFNDEWNFNVEFKDDIVSEKDFGGIKTKFLKLKSCKN